MILDPRTGVVKLDMQAVWWHSWPQKLLVPFGSGLENVVWEGDRAREWIKRSAFRVNILKYTPVGTPCPVTK